MGELSQQLPLRLTDWAHSPIYEEPVTPPRFECCKKHLCFVPSWQDNQLAKSCRNNSSIYIISQRQRTQAWCER